MADPYQKKDKTAKNRHRETLIEYMSDPWTPALSRSKLATEVLGFSSQCSLYQYFTPAELREIDEEALALRRSCYANKMALVDDGLLAKAATGDPAACKLAYQKIEGWVPESKVAIEGAMLNQFLAIFPPEFADKVRMALAARHKELAG